MGYDFIGRKRKNDDGYVASACCMYAYEAIFKECFGKNVVQYSGRMTKEKARQFRMGVDKLANNPTEYNLDAKQIKGYLANCSYLKLVEDLYGICDAIDNKEIGYLTIS